MKDALGDRMKKQYEDRTRYFLPRRTYTIIRIDGKAFHSFTKGMERPFDTRLMDCMDRTTKALCENIQGTVIGYTQSDEISILLTDFEKETTSAFFDGNIQKIASISASIATATFNREFFQNFSGSDKMAYFDSRVFTIPDPVEVENYFVWRQKDAIRNSISMTAQSLYSHKELHGKNTNEMQELCFQKGVNWNDMPNGFKRGRFVMKEYYEVDGTQRSKWEISPAFEITKERERFSSIIPNVFVKQEIE